MSTIRKRGNSYQIRVSCGYNVSGEQITKTTTWKPAPNMTKRQIEKELERQAVLFEEKCRSGLFLDGNITFTDFAEKWFKEYAEKQLRIQTVTCYKRLITRILSAIGHIKVCQLQPHHLLEFYNNLGEMGIRKDIKYKPCTDFKQRTKAAGYSHTALAGAANVSISSIRICLNGGNVTKATADKITAATGLKNLFTQADGKKRLSDSTIAEYHRLISSILTTAVQWQVIPSNPCDRVKPPKVERKEAASLDAEQAAELIRCLQDEPLKYKAAVMLTLYTGLRRGELCGLEWEDINLDEGIVCINKSVLYTAAKGIYEDGTKTKSSNRAINIPDDMIKLLRRYKAEQTERRLSMGDAWQNSGKVFTAENGGYIHPDTLTAWFKSFIRRHSLPDIHFHSLRHTAATLLIAEGVDVATVSKRLGHADKTTTLNIYTHAVKSADKAAADKLQSLFRNSAI